MNDRLIIDIIPKAKPRMTRSDTWKKRPCVTEYWTYKDELTLAAKQQNFVLGDCYYVCFELPVPQSYSKKKAKELIGKPHKKKPDKDNLEKAINDCLKEHDQSVYFNVSEKKYGETGRLVIININHENINKILQPI